jgi:predicted chitinase
VTRRVNGGFNGLADRESKYNTLITMLDVARG